MRLYFLALVAVLLLGCAGAPPGGNKTNATDCGCAAVSEQVCGSDGKTYASSCMANCSGASVSHPGPCASCTDSDGGKNASVKGTISSDGMNYTDYCVVFESVEEYYCVNTTAGKETIACQQGYECREGACVVKQPAQPLPECTDSDGNDAFMKGTVKAGGAEFNDSCADYKSVNEYYCELGEAKVMETVCPSDFRCDGGKCFKPGTTCTDTDSGDDIYNGGKVTVKGGLTSAEYLDKCLDDHRVREYHCDAGGYVSEDVQCPDGYRCVQASCRQDLCTDTDEGYSIFQKGAVSKGSDLRRDKCTDNYGGVEYYCDNNMIINATFVCPAGYTCSDGACEK